MDDRPNPDAFEKCVRFACGFGLGALIAAGSILTNLATFTVTSVAVAAFVAVVFGFLAMRFGDGFWRCLSEWSRWW